MTLPRSHRVHPDEPGHYHIVSRCVRRTFLCGHDPLSGIDYSHRKRWILDRIAALVPSYAIEINGYAVMSNHFHLAVYVDPGAARAWSDEEVIERWLRAYPASGEAGDQQTRNDVERRRMRANAELLAERRGYLGSLSHFMKHLKQPIARRANEEDEITGHFFEGRFYSGVLLDVPAIVECLAYIDLNPVRAGIAKTLKECRLTAIVERIRRAEADERSRAEALTPMFSGLPASRSGLRQAGVTLDLDEYIRHCERRMAESDTDEDDPTRCFRRRQRAYGTLASLDAYAERLGLKRNCSRPLPG